MKKTHWLKSVLTLGLLMPLLAIPQGELAQPVRAGRNPAPWVALSGTYQTCLPQVMTLR